MGDIFQMKINPPGFPAFLVLSIVFCGYTHGQSQTPDEKAGSLIALKPVTRPILEMIHQSGNDIKSVPYFISDSFSLEYSKTTQNLEITEKGEVVLKEIAVKNRISIPGETAGTLAAVNYDSGGRMLLAINFDESGETYPLIFREGDWDRSFYLVHYALSSKERKLYYGEQLFDLQSETIPRLQIRFEEIEEPQTTTKTLQGRRPVSERVGGL